ncbi:MAG: phosphate ABC transporter permease PstA [Eubacteriaceae bacterium]|nr:phosphate ABC transporter permease PstA [Eubacteriaceae bacterium]
MKNPINQSTFKRRMREYQKRPASFVMFILVMLCACVTVLSFVFLVGYLLYKGIPNISWDLFALNYNSENVSLLPSLINTVTITFLALSVSGPTGIFAAIYLVEYAKKGNKLVKLMDLTSETLSGIPSIVYGLFGMLFFVVALDWGFSVLAGACTLAIMVLPLIMRTTQEALRSVPAEFREGAFGLGADKVRVIFKIVLPPAVPGILSGVILAVGRIVGETASLIYTAGTVAEIPESLFSSGRTLAVHMYALFNEGLYIEKAYATGVVLLVIVCAMNLLSNYVAKKLTR